MASMKWQKVPFAVKAAIINRVERSEKTDKPRSAQDSEEHPQHNLEEEGIDYLRRQGARLTCSR